MRGRRGVAEGYTEGAAGGKGFRERLQQGVARVRTAGPG